MTNTLTIEQQHRLGLIPATPAPVKTRKTTGGAKPETIVKAALRERLAACDGVQHIPIVATGYTSDGIADAIINWRGTFVAVEAKANTSLTPEQWDFLQATCASGGLGYVLQVKHPTKATAEAAAERLVRRIHLECSTWRGKMPGPVDQDGEPAARPKPPKVRL
jgi:hypothetical protein